MVVSNLGKADLSYFTAPSVKPPTKDFCKSRNTISVGMAAVIVAAEIGS